MMVYLVTHSAGGHDDYAVLAVFKYETAAEDYVNAHAKDATIEAFPLYEDLHYEASE